MKIFTFTCLAFFILAHLTFADDLEQFGTPNAIDALPQPKAIVNDSKRPTDWDDVELAVGAADVISLAGFHESMRYWSGGFPVDEERRFEGISDIESITSVDVRCIQVHGDCLGKLVVSKPDSIVHIRGDLSGTVIVSGQSEVIVGGDLTPSGRIVAEGITKIFIAGDAHGTVENSSWTTLWVRGDGTGTIYTGSPITNIYVCGDFIGDVKPAKSASILYMVIGGYMPYSSLEKISVYGYTEFKSSIGRSDKTPGIYFTTKNTSWTILCEGKPRTTHEDGHGR